MSTDPLPLAPGAESTDYAKRPSNPLQLIGWFSVGLAVAVVSVYVGVELRSRYLFKKRTPYDFYSNVSEQPAGEFGVGI
jgi:hypothetical protein